MHHFSRREFLAHSTAAAGLLALGPQALLAAEADKPKTVIPKAINQVIYRILIFYVGALVVLLSLTPWDNLVASLDASGGSYFQAINALLQSTLPGTDVTVAGWPESGWQIDADFPRYLPLPDTLSRTRHLGDSIMTAIVLGALAGRVVRFTDLGRLRVQECERVVALRSELTKCGAKVLEEGDTLVVYPSPLHGAEIETYDDHRMAMCFAILGLKVPGIKLKNPSCVKKTFPNFFQKLAGAPPHGLGARILEGSSGRPLGEDELFAE